MIHTRTQLHAALHPAFFAQFLTFTLASCLTAGCSNTLMETPVAVDTAGANPFVQTPNTRQTDEITVFVASNRKVVPGNPMTTYFSNNRSDSVHVGTMRVKIGKNPIAWPALQTVSRQDARKNDPIVALSALDDFGGIWAGATAMEPDPIEDERVRKQFAEAVNAALADSSVKSIYLFVHGFNTTVPNNAELSAQMFHYLGRNGVFMLFDWPSLGSLFGYQEDKSAATASVRTLRRLLSILAERTTATTIHILAHSAGAPIAVEAVHELRLIHTADTMPEAKKICKIGQLVLVAPDMDLGEFRDAVADGTTELPEQVSVYISSRDKALDLSAWIAGFARLGQPLQELSPRMIGFLENNENVDLIDVGRAERRLGSWLGHSYFHEDPWVSSDVLLNLQFQMKPLERGLVFDEKLKIFAFGPNYPSDARTAARKAFGQSATDSIPSGAGVNSVPSKNTSKAP